MIEFRPKARWFHWLNSDRRLGGFNDNLQFCEFTVPIAWPLAAHWFRICRAVSFNLLSSFWPGLRGQVLLEWRITWQAAWMPDKWWRREAKTMSGFRFSMFAATFTLKMHHAYSTDCFEPLCIRVWTCQRVVNWLETGLKLRTYQLLLAAISWLEIQYIQARCIWLRTSMCC